MVLLNYSSDSRQIPGELQYHMDTVVHLKYVAFKCFKEECAQYSFTVLCLLVLNTEMKQRSINNPYISFDIILAAQHLLSHHKSYPAAAQTFILWIL